MGLERNKKIIIRILIIIIIALVLFAGYIILINNPKFKVKSAVRYIFNEADSALELAQGSSVSNIFLENKTEITNRLTAKVSLSNEIITNIGPIGKNIEDLINGSIIETNIKSDVPNKYTNMSLDYLYNNEKITANAYIDSNEIYILIKDYFDKYIKFDAGNSFETVVSGVNVDEIRYLVNIFKKSIVDGVSYGTVTNSKEEIDIDEQKVPVNKTTLTIDTEFTNKVTTILLNKILMDNKAKEIVLKLVDSTTYPDVASLENYIREQLLNIETATSDNEVLGEYSLYTLGVFNNVIRNEIKSFSDNTAIQYTTYKTAKFDTQTSIYNNNELMAKLDIKETSEDNYDTSIVFGKDMSMDINGIISKSKVDVNYTLRISGMDDIKGAVNIETKNISKTEMNQIVTIKLDTPESYGTVNLTAITTLKTIDNIIKPDFSNNVKFDELSTGQLMDIYTNFQNKNAELIKAIDKISNSSMDIYSYEE